MCIVCQAKSILKPDYTLIFGPGATDEFASAALASKEPGYLETTNLTSSNAATTDQNINGVLSNTRFGTLTLTFAFPQLATDYEANYASINTTTGQVIGSFSPITAAMQTAARFSFELASQLTGLTITEGPVSTANFRLGLFEPNADKTGPQTAFAYLPTTSIVGGDSWYSNTASFTLPTRGNYAWATILHEIGHNLGLKHGHETGGPAGVAMTSNRDSMEFSIMTYRSFIGSDTAGYSNERWGFAQTFMMYDIAALQHLSLIHI